MNKLFKLLFVVLLLINGFLGYQVYELTNDVNALNNSKPGKQISQIVSEFETDVTRVVAEVNDKVVSIMQIRNNQLVGSGTGVVYEVNDDKVYIVTNHHVIENGESIVVKLSNGEEVSANVIGSDVYSDLALLEIEGDYDLKPFKLGDSSLIKVGEFVVAIGSPLGVEFSNSTTFGIISGKERLVPVDLNGDGMTDWDMVVTQTDAAINPGNSGGALVNMNGELIGINSLKISSNKIEGMGFSIPINEVEPIIAQLKENGEIVYPIVGISAIAVNDLSQAYKEQIGILENTNGVLVVEVSLGAAAYRAGIKKDDVIVGFDGTKVKNFKDFRRILHKKKKGETAIFEVARGQEVLEIEVVLD